MAAYEIQVSKTSLVIISVSLQTNYYLQLSFRWCKIWDLSIYDIWIYLPYTANTSNTNNDLETPLW
jgi:hypothetical protein